MKINKANNATIWSNRLWAIDRKTLANMLASTDLLADSMPCQQEPDEDDQPYSNVSGVALINVIGPMAKYEDIFMQIFGGVSTICIQNALSAANADPAVSAVCLWIDSPGGQVNGTLDLADAIGKSEKPVYAYISDSGCSSAYWIASQCDRVFINRSGFTGSIGIYATVADTSKLYESAGAKIIIVRQGKYKGVGEPGTEITPDDLVPLQNEIDGIYELFVNNVANGRGLSSDTVKALADGSCYLASEALSLGLVDEIVANNQVINTILGELTMSNKVVEQVKTEAIKALEQTTAIKAEVAETTKDPAGETVAVPVEVPVVSEFVKGQAETKAQFAAILTAVKGDNALAIECFQKGLTEQDAKSAYADKVIAENERLAKELKSLKASKSGAEPVALATSSGGSPAPSDSKDEDAIKADWEANKGDVQKQFSNLKVYSAFRRHCMK